MSVKLWSGLIPDPTAFKDAFPAMAMPWMDTQASALDPLAARAGVNDLPPLRAREVAFGAKDRTACAWALSEQSVAVSAQRQPVVFVETATPTAAASAHAQWLGWQQQSARDGHPTYCIVLAHWGAVAADSQDASQALNACLEDARSKQGAALVLRFDAAASVMPCLLAEPQRIAQLVLGPLPLWPLPSAQPGVHPLTALHTLLGWLDNGSFSAVVKAARQLLDHPLTSSAAPGLLQAAIWQEQLARAPLPREASAHALAAMLGPWLVPGMASVLADDWALRRVLPEASAADWPVRAVFAAEDAEPARAWAEDYIRGLLGAWGAECQVVMGVHGRLPLTMPVRAAQSPAQAMAAKPARARAVTKPAKAARKPRASVKPDDLKLIEGIGPQIAKLLNQDGITTFEGLSRAPVSRLQKVLTAAGPRFAMAKPGTWPRQARLLAKGDQAAFEALTQRLRGGVEA